MSFKQKEIDKIDTILRQLKSEKVGTFCSRGTVYGFIWFEIEAPGRVRSRLLGGLALTALGDKPA